MMVEKESVGELNVLREELIDELTAGSTGPPRLLVVAGPSGVGKGTLLAQLRRKYPSEFEFCVSHTSRRPRHGERHGVEYYFTDRDKLLDAAANGKFMEYAHIFGNVYGTSLAEIVRIKKSGKICLLEIDVQGVQQVKASSLAKFCNFLFIDPPGNDVLEQRLRRRATETEESLQRRLSEALHEISEANKLQFDYRLVNADFDAAFEKLDECLCKWFPELHTAVRCEVGSLSLPSD